ncbi:MAG: MBL fold metallo-hydrolase [Phycisphaerae bacterium]|nr:MBL fold metallo-hydrolase [Phycisphaerae bacterium]
MSSPTPPGAESPIIDTFTLGPYATNCYLVRVGGEAWIIDASFDPDPIIDRLRRLGIKPQALILTHAHIDHIAGVRDLLHAFPGTPLWIHEAEKDWLLDPELNLSAFAGLPITTPPAERLLRDGDDLMLGATSWRVLHTPGHSPGGITLHHEPSRTAFVGDALFAGSIGRTDFPGCSFEQLERSIRSKLYTLPEQTTIYPGHGETSTIGEERRDNPFVRG